MGWGSCAENFQVLNRWDIFWVGVGMGSPRASPLAIQNPSFHRKDIIRVKGLLYFKAQVRNSSRLDLKVVSETNKDSAVYPM